MCVCGGGRGGGREAKKRVKERNAKPGKTKKKANKKRIHGGLREKIMDKRNGKEEQYRVNPVRALSGVVSVI